MASGSTRPCSISRMTAWPDPGTAESSHDGKVIYNDLVEIECVEELPAKQSLQHHAPARGDAADCGRCCLGASCGFNRHAWECVSEVFENRNDIFRGGINGEVRTQILRKAQAVRRGSDKRDPGRSKSLGHLEQEKPNRSVPVNYQIVFGRNLRLPYAVERYRSRLDERCSPQIHFL